MRRWGLRGIALNDQVQYFGAKTNVVFQTGQIGAKNQKLPLLLELKQTSPWTLWKPPAWVKQWSRGVKGGVKVAWGQ